jgi:hypothetical protein
VVDRIRGFVVEAAGYRTDSCAPEVMGVDTLNRGQRRYIATSTSPSPGTDASIIRIAPRKAGRLERVLGAGVARTPQPGMCHQGLPLYLARQLVLACLTEAASPHAAPNHAARHRAWYGSQSRLAALQLTSLATGIRTTLEWAGWASGRSRCHKHP